MDPNNPDRVFFDTFDVWFATRTGTVWNDTTCGYSTAGAQVRCTWTNMRSRSCPARPAFWLFGNDGGVHGTTNADIATQTIGSDLV